MSLIPRLQPQPAQSSRLASREVALGAAWTKDSPASMCYRHLSWAQVDSITVEVGTGLLDRTNFIY